MLRDETLRRAQQLDKKYFGNRGIDRLVKALFAQARAMKSEPTKTNIRKQAGDMLFVLAALERNTGWPLDELLSDAIQKILKRRRDRHYYEAHVTIEPVFGERREEFTKIAREYGFHVAELLMQKRKKDSPIRSSKDAFCTGRSISSADLEDRMVELVRALKAARFQVWRYKIESTVLDSRYDDSLIPLHQGALPEKERKPGSPAEGALSGKKRKLLSKKTA